MHKGNDNPSPLTLLHQFQRRVGDGRAFLFSREDFSLRLPSDVGLESAEWPSLWQPAEETLWDLFNRSSHENIRAAYERSKITQIASTTTILKSGKAAKLTIDIPFPEADYGIGHIADGPLIASTSTATESHLRTRFVCDYDGHPVSVSGPHASFALEAGQSVPWGGQLLEPAERSLLISSATAVSRDGSPYEIIRLQGVSASLVFDVVIVPVEESIILDYFDVSHQSTAIAALERVQIQFDRLSETLPVGVFQVGPEGSMEFVSSKARELFGPEFADAFEWLDRLHPEDRSILEERIADLPRSRRIDAEVRMLAASGDYLNCRVSGADVRDGNGELEYVVGFIEDMTEWLTLQKRVEDHANFDDLTGLPNRTTFVRHLRERLETHQLEVLAVLFIDLDGFKLINDTQGHNVGDIVLVDVAQRFRRAIRPSDLIARFGGDEFIVVAFELGDESEAMAIGRRLHDALATPVLAEGRIIAINASVGIAISEPGTSTSEQLIGDADIAMYEAKASGRNRSILFDTELRHRASQRFDMTADLRHARRRRELRVVYQPIVELSTGIMSGAEALLRWDHPTHGIVMPDNFVSLAEEIGLIDDLGEFVIEQSCADLHSLRSAGLVGDDFIMSLNISAIHFQNITQLATSSLDAVTQHGLNPSQLRFELTESIPLTEIPEAAANIRYLTGQGFGLAIDDFGTGYSSLGYLTMLPFDALKLDLSLVQGLRGNSPALAVVESLTTMASQMGFCIVAEGIETSQQRSLLVSSGVNLGQGFLISKPVALAALVQLLESTLPSARNSGE